MKNLKNWKWIIIKFLLTDLEKYLISYSCRKQAYCSFNTMSETVQDDTRILSEIGRKIKVDFEDENYWI